MPPDAQCVASSTTASQAPKQKQKKNWEVRYPEAPPCISDFSVVVGLIPRLQRQSEDKTIGPPRKLAFALRIRFSRNCSRSFAGGSGAQWGLTGLYCHPRVAKYTCRMCIAASDMAHSTACILIPQVAFTAAHCLL